MENNNIKKHETSSVYEMDGRRFIINAFDPMTGNYLLMQVISFILPFGIGDALGKAVGTEGTSTLKIGSTGKMMGKEEFISFQKDVLSTIQEEYDSGNRSPVVRENGTYGVSDVTMQMLIKLLIASLAFNFKDFFEEIPSIEGLIGNSQIPVNM